MSKKFGLEHALWQRNISVLLIAVIVLVHGSLFLGQGVYAQDVSALSIANIKRQLKLIESDSLIADGEKKKLLAAYQDCLELKRSVKKEREKAEQFREQANQIPQDTANLKKELDQPLKDPLINIGGIQDRKKLLEIIEGLVREYEAANVRYQTLSGSTEVQDLRRSQVLEAMDKRKVQISDAETALSRPPVEGMSLQLKLARHYQLLARQELLKAQLETLTEELPALDAIKVLAPLQLAEAKRRVDLFAASVETAQNRLKELEAKEARKESDAFEKLIAGFEDSNPHIRKLISEVRTLHGFKAGAEGSLIEKIEEGRNTKLLIKRQLDDLTRDYSEIRHRYQLVGASRGMGRLLLAVKNELPSLSELRWQESQLEDQLLEEQIVLFRLEERREALSDPASEAEGLLKPLAVYDKKTDQRLSQTVHKLSAMRDRLLNSLLSGYPEYVNSLFDSLHFTKKYRSTVKEAREFIMPRVLWVPVGDKGVLPRYDHLTEAVLWFVNPRGWLLTFRAAIKNVHQNLMLHILLLILFAIVFFSRSKLRVLDKHYASLVSRYSSDSIQHTLKCLGAAMLRALPGPLLVWLVASILGNPIAESEHGIAFSQALKFSALYLFVALFVYEVLSPKGLGISHFGWPEKTCAQVRRNLRWFIALGFVLLIISRVTILRSTPTAFDSLGRLIQSSWLLVFSWFLYRTLGWNSELGRHFQRKAHEGFLMRSYRYWSLVIINLPIVFVVLGVFGYYYATRQFLQSYYLSLGLLVGLFLLSELLNRWLFIARREAAIKKKRAERVASRLQLQEKTSDEAGPELDSFEEGKFDIPKMDANTKTLFRSGIGALFFIGMFLIWADTFPALQILSRIQVWPELKVVSSADQWLSSTAENAPAATSVVESTGTTPLSSPIGGATLLGTAQAEEASDVVLADEVTLLDLLLALVILVVVYIATKNLPSLIEIMLLQQLQLDKGVRYAASALTRYTVTLIGVSFALSVLGITWSSIQWLAAALTFGLAFGLQEIFANFISGIIVLFEQPVRIGDTVTIGQTTGIVTRIRMRATTVTDWDRKELVIPNKQFVTGEIINWSLSDSMLRVIVPVGVAYGSDTKRVIELLEKIAAEQKKVLAEPKPDVLFRAFGASSLDFELRAFVARVEDRFSLVHELLFTIDQEFRKAGIEIAFPQRDLHIRSSDTIFRSEQVAVADSGERRTK